MDISNTFKQAFSNISGGRVLDVGTQEGGFVRVMMENFADCADVTGIDIDAHSLGAARDTFDQKNVRFVQMDAERIGFCDESFDTVSVALSLHHLANAPRILTEMMRVLRPGGHFIVSEMHRDAQTEPQHTVVQLHHWVADMDNELGVPHYRTLARQEIMDFVADVGLEDVAHYDFSDVDSDPADEESIERVKDVIGKRTQRAEGLADYEAFKQRGEEIERRLHEVGVQWEPVVVVVGKKR